MEDEIIIIKSKPSAKTIGFSFCGTIFFGTFAYILLSAEWNISADTNFLAATIIMYILCGVFLFFAVWCFWEFLRVKTVILTNKRLIIKRYLLFFQKNIPINNIKDISESPYTISGSGRGSIYQVYDGKQVQIKLKKGKSIKLNSFEIADYYSLIGHLQAISKDKNAFLRKKMECESSIRYRYQGYGWLLFVIIMTLGLVISVIKQKLG